MRRLWYIPGKQYPSIPDYDHDLVMKPEITLSDINHQLNKKYGYYYGSSGEYLIKEPKVERLLATIKTWLRDGTRGFFDGQTYFGKVFDGFLSLTNIPTYSPALTNFISY